jgi:hypothetical protein
MVATSFDATTASWMQLIKLAPEEDRRFKAASTPLA